MHQCGRRSKQGPGLPSATAAQQSSHCEFTSESHGDSICEVLAMFVCLLLAIVVYLNIFESSLLSRTSANDKHQLSSYETVVSSEQDTIASQLASCKNVTNQPICLPRSKNRQWCLRNAWPNSAEPAAFTVQDCRKCMSPAAQQFFDSILLLEGFANPHMQHVQVHQQQQQQAYPGVVPGHQPPPSKQLGPGMQLHSEHATGLTQPHEKPSCPESRFLYNKLISQLSLAACEAQLEHMVLHPASSSSSSHTSSSRSSRSSSLSGYDVHPSNAQDSMASQGPYSMTPQGSPLSPDAFQELLFRMLQEEWSTQVQEPSA